MVVDDPAIALIFHGDAVCQKAVESPVVLNQAWTIRMKDFADRFFNGIGWNLWVNSSQRFSQPPDKTTSE